MTFEGRRHAGTTRLNLVPLINIIFLLLIFFMFAGSLKLPEPFPVTLPVQGDNQTSSEPLYETLTLHIGTQGQLALNGRVIGWEDLSSRLAALPQERRHNIARIDIDATAPTGELTRAMESLKQAGLQSVLLSTRVE